MSKIRIVRKKKSSYDSNHYDAFLNASPAIIAPLLIGILVALNFIYDYVPTGEIPLLGSVYKTVAVNNPLLGIFIAIGVVLSYSIIGAIIIRLSLPLWQLMHWIDYQIEDTIYFWCVAAWPIAFIATAIVFPIFAILKFTIDIEDEDV